MKIGLIGGAGYIGAHIVLALQETNHDIVVFENFSTGQQENISVRYMQGDIRNPADLEQFFSNEKPELIIHLAALKAAGESMQKPELYAQTNIQGTINLLNAMVSHNCKKIIFSSSAAVYGEPQYDPIDESHPTVPLNFYGYTKLEVEQLLHWYGRLHSIKYVALRYFNAAGYDPRITLPEKNPANLLPILLEAVTDKRAEVQLYGDDYDTADGTCIRDYIHVTDLADAHLKALSYLQSGSSASINLGTGKGISVKECIAAAQALGPFAVTVVPRRPGDPAILTTSNQKAKELLNWTPQHSDLHNILQTMYAVYRKL